MLRRKLISSGLVAGLVIPVLPRVAFATPQEFEQIEPLAFELDRDPPTLDDLKLIAQEETGNDKPYTEEIKKAEELWNAAPINCRPYDVAEYFLKVGAGDYGNELATYVAEWPVRYNPVIVNFFTATSTRRPDGDITAWCSAFVNWCILRSREGREDKDNLTRRSDDALAQSFSKFGQEATNPQLGDIVVFKRLDKPGNGHVGFFVGQDSKSVALLGGNQRPVPGKAFNTGEVNLRRFSKLGNLLVLKTIRTDVSLQDR